MYALINSIYDNLETPEHVRAFLMAHVDTSTVQGNALFDVLSMIHDFKNSISIAHYQFGFDGSVFEQLGDKIIARLCATSNQKELETMVCSLSEKLSTFKDEYGFVDMGNLSWEEANYWLSYGEQNDNTPSARKELSG